MISTFYGYLEAAYMLAPYLSDFATGATHSQLNQRIEDSLAVRSQLEQRVEATDSVLVQIDQRIDSGIALVLGQIEGVAAGAFEASMQLDQRIEDASKLVLVQLDRRATGILDASPMQIEQRIEDAQAVRGQIEQTIETEAQVLSQIDQKTVGDALSLSQLEQRIADSQALRSQLEARVETPVEIGMQVEGRIDSLTSVTRMELGRGPVSHAICNGYLQEGYLEAPYLSTLICASMRTQIERRLADEAPIHSQIEGRVADINAYRMQLEGRITDDRAIGMQILRQTAYKLNSQLIFSIYNTTNLRVLWEFPSRGSDGTNWTVTAGGTAPGDFSINNVNTDIVEEKFRSVNTSVTIDCDTEIVQGIFNDTLGILGHNLTTSATVTMQGTNDPTYSSIGISEALPVESENIYWVSEFLPLSSYRYWRFIITDSTNTAGYVQIGTIVFGSSLIFNGECFIDEVVRRKVHFADRIRTEGFSAVSNDRALKRSVSLTFRRLDFNKDNYENLIEAVDTLRTSLKALWIPTPQYASRFAVFGKLSEIPVENHKAISRTSDWIDLDITVDEAL